MKTKDHLLLRQPGVAPATILALLLAAFLLFSPAQSESEAESIDPAAIALLRSAGDLSKAPDGPLVNPVASRDARRLIADSKGTAEVSYNRATGVASFVRLEPGTLELPLAVNATAVETADTFLEEYGGIFGVTDADAQLAISSATTDDYGLSHVAYQQLYQGVPVYAATLRVHLDAAVAVYAANGVFIPSLSLKTDPSLSPEEAGIIAINAVAGAEAHRGNATNLHVVDTQLTVFRDGLVRGEFGDNHLAYAIEVANTPVTTREFVFVDAHSGEVVDNYSGIHEGLGRQVSETTLGNVAWTEGDPDPITPGWAGGTAQQITDWQNEIDGARETYNLFASMAGWDSYDNSGATMRTVNNDPGISCPNANWNGISTNYCTDVTGDDTVAHEWGHAYTDFTNDLIYQWQSGALNESYSDIWGDTVDLLNGRGLDAPDIVRAANTCSSNPEGANFPGHPTADTVRWLSGEDDEAFSGIPAGSGNAIRDMWDPTCFGDPGKVSDNEYWCSTGDAGGVHTNSGVPNHAFALLVDGGTYNGQTISALGLTKTAHIHWSAQNMLTPSSNFMDHADALEAACTSLIGVNLGTLSTNNPSPGSSSQMITAADCVEVAEAVTAVELRSDPTQCNFGPVLSPDAPPLCEDLGDVDSISLTDWEAGLGAWTVGTRNVANPATFDTPDWAVVSSLPDGRSGQAAFVLDSPELGDCDADTEAGVLYLQSPVIALPADALVPRIAVDHWVATEIGWDGGNIKASVNGGPWTLIPTENFDFNAYNSSLNLSDNPMGGEPAFTGTDGGTVNGSWGQSQISLLGIAGPGDEVQIRIEMGLDGCNGVVGWYVDDVEVYSCAAELPGSSCGNGEIDAGETCDDGNTDDGDGCSSICSVEDGWFCTTPEATAGGASNFFVDDVAIPVTDGGDAILDGGFEAGSPSPNWSEASTNFGTPLCTTGICGTGGGSGPYSGTWWAWFGGINAYEEGSVSQVVAIPPESTELKFFLEQPVCDSPADYLELLVDGNQEFVVDGGSALCGTTSYSEQTVDIGAYADGAEHSMEFHSEIFAQGHPAEPSTCTPLGVCSAPNLAIPDNDPMGVDDSLVVSRPGKIGDLNVYLDVSHTWVGDLKFTLTHEESGTIVPLIDRPGVSNGGVGCSGNNIDAMLDDEGSGGSVESICDNDPALGGILVPYPGSLTDFDGEARAGTWTLNASDNAGLDTGTVNQWCVAASVETPTAVSLSSFQGDTTTMRTSAAVLLAIGVMAIGAAVFLARRRSTA